jgi:hypothetical protein
MVPPAGSAIRFASRAIDSGAFASVSSPRPALCTARGLDDCTGQTFGQREITSLHIDLHRILLRDGLGFASSTRVAKKGSGERGASRQVAEPSAGDTVDQRAGPQV